MESGEAVIPFHYEFYTSYLFNLRKKYVARIVLESIFDLRLVNFF